MAGLFKRKLRPLYVGGGHTHTHTLKENIRGYETRKGIQYFSEDRLGMNPW